MADYRCKCGKLLRVDWLRDRWGVFPVYSLPLPERFFRLYHCPDCGQVLNPWPYHRQRRDFGPRPPA